jgi:hypothetical protein
MSNACDTSKEGCSSGAAQAQCNTNTNTECCDMPEKLLCLADEAWREVVKEKIKAEIEKTAGQKLDKVAKLVAEANHRRWAHLIEGKQKCDDFKTQLKEAMFGLSQ